ncbi:MAG TPA: DnaJ domain-containing protein, partial [Thermoanaerobaculia bacterium]
GLVSRQVLDAEMRRLVEEIVFSTFEWEQGEFRFQSSTGVLDPDVALTLSTAAIIVESIRRLPDSEGFLRLLGQAHSVPILATDPMSRYQYLPLSPQEAYLLSRIDGVLDIESLLKIGGTSRAGTAKTLYALFSCGIVEWKKEGVPAVHPGGFEGLNVVVDAQPKDGTPGHFELVRNTYRRIDWLSHYELLGVPANATTEQIGKAYFERSRLFHPDLRHREDLGNLERELTAVFERLKHANEVLSDPVRRREYDESLDAAPVPVAVAETASDPAARKHLAQQSYNRARHLIEQKDFHPAVEMLREAIRFVPDNAEYRLLLGQVELRNSLWISKGLENLKEAARLEPRKVQNIRAAARALLQHGRNDEAETFARRAVELDPSAENQELLDQILLGTPVASAPEPVPIESGPAEETGIEAAAGGPPPERPGLFSRLFRSRS